MSVVSVTVEIHLVLAFLSALCALIFSWTPNGRRVVNAVVGLQFIAGLVVAGTLSANHMPLPPTVWLHLLIAILIMASYGAAIRFGKRAGGARPALILSILGLVLILANIWLGAHIAGMV